MTEKSSKILVLTTVHQYNDVRIFYKQINSLKKNYPNIVYIAQHEQKNQFFENGINIDPLPITKNRFSRIANLQIISFRKVIKHKPDIIHFHDPELIPLVWTLKKIVGCKVIFDVHESIVESFEVKPYIPHRLTPIIGKLYSGIERLFIKNFNAKIVVKESFRTIYGNDATVIKNYPLPSRSTNVLKDFNSKINLVYSGVIMKDRGFPKIFNIYSELLKINDNLHFNIIGRIDTEELKNQIQKSIEELNLQTKVTLHGMKTIEEVYEILENCHIGISLMEPNFAYLNALTTKIFDYMVNGIPYIVSDFEIYKEYTIKENTGLTVDYNDDISIVKTIESMLNNRSLLDTMSKNCFKAIQDKWNWETQEEILFNLYKKLLMIR